MPFRNLPVETVLASQRHNVEFVAGIPALLSDCAAPTGGAAGPLSVLLLRFLRRSRLRRHFQWSLDRRFLCSGLLCSPLLCHGWLRHCLGGMERRPALLCRCRYRPSASGTELPFALRGVGRGGWLRRIFGCSPPFPLCITDALPGGSTQLSPFTFWNFLRSSWFGTATGEHGPDLGNLSVYPPLLGFETLDGGGKDFGSELLRRHLSHSYEIGRASCRE